MKILSVTSGRADVGILAPVWRAIRAMGAELHVFLTGAHVTDPTAAKAALPQGAVAHMGGEDLAGRLGADASGAMAKIMEDAGALAARLVPDRALVVADRLDMIPAALAFVPFNMPVAHLHGGEQTLGAVDDRTRHAITKLAHLHCVANVDAAQRVARMGEEGWRIHVTGAPGLDTIAQAPVMTEAEFAQAVGFDSIAGLRLVTVHPETNAADPLAAYEAVVAALEETPAPTLFTAPNADPGGAALRARMESFAKTRPWARFRDTLGGMLYANALRHAAAMVGNSSSGIVEAGLFGLPVINVGRRQDGRLRGPNVRDCAAEAGAVARLLRAVPQRQPSVSPYGDGTAGPRVAAALLAPHDKEKLLFKRFAEERPAFTAPWNETRERRAG